MRRACSTTLSPIGVSVTTRVVRSTNGTPSVFFQFPQLAAECRLRDVTAFRRATEMAQIRYRDQIAQLGKGQWYFPYSLRLLMKSHL